MTALTLNSLYLSPQRVWEIVKRIQALEEGSGGAGDVTKESIGLGRVDNTSDQEKPPSQPTQLLLQSVSNDLNDAIELRPLATVVTADLKAHTDLKTNPHSVTKAQVGLGNVDNTTDLNKPVSTATTTALAGKADKADTYTKAEVDALIEALKTSTG